MSNAAEKLYLLERIKAACPDKYGGFHTFSDGEEYSLCRELEADGLIELAIDEYAANHCMWVLKR